MKPQTFQTASAGSTAGLTLVELLVGLAVVGVMMAVAIPAMSDFLERRRVIAVAGELVNIMAYAKAETNVVGDNLYIHMENDPNSLMSCVAITNQTPGDDCKCYYAPNQVCPTSGTLLRLFQLPRTDSVAFRASASPWNGRNYVASYSRQTRQLSASNMRFTVTGLRTGVTLRVEVNEAGRTRICSPVGRLGGFATCAS